MENKIFKSYAKKILRSEAFVSVIIVFVLALGIIGTSYALYMDVDTDTNYQLVEVGDLSIGFDNGENSITLSNMTPTTNDIAIQQNDNLFSFYIYNTGSYIAKYNIKLVTESGNTVDTQYINYQICRDNKDNCKDIDTLNTSEIIYKDELSPNSEDNYNKGGGSAYYFLRVWINDSYSTNLMNNDQTVKLKVVIEATNASGNYETTNTLVGKILNNENITINNTQPIFNTIADYKIKGDSTSGEPGLYKAEDDYGISYYFRGVQSNNYVNFAGHIWRIVRINGDGSVKLILNDYLKDSSNNYITTSYSGYDFIYKNLESSDYDSYIVSYLNDFYNNTIVANDYEEYIADIIFCNDCNYRSEAGDGSTSTAIFYYYSAYDRISKNSPSLKCDEGSNNTDFRYTAYGTKTTLNVETNDGLDYPIGLLTADEIILAGGGSANNTSYYLQLDNKSWWTMTPSYEDHGPNGSYGFMYIVGNQGSLSGVNIYGSDSNYIRPVINITKDALYESGDGTVMYPYTLKLS